MNPQYKLLREITPTTRGWIAKLTVIEKLIPRITRNGVLYQRIILADIEPVQEEFRIVDNQFEWSLNTSTSIEETTKENQWNFEDLYNLYYLDQLDAYVDAKTSVDIVAVVLSVDPIKKIHTKSEHANIQEFLLVDQRSINNEEYLSAIINEKRLFPSQTALRTLQYNNIITINGIQNLPQEQHQTACGNIVLVTSITNVKQGREESLRSYIQRFNTEVTKVGKMSKDKIKFSIAAGVHSRGGLWKNMLKRGLDDLDDFYERVEKYIRMEEGNRVLRGVLCPKVFQGEIHTSRGAPPHTKVSSTHGVLLACQGELHAPDPPLTKGSSTHQLLLPLKGAPRTSSSSYQVELHAPRGSPHTSSSSH
uniref:Uncharacterized protein n=1 Tax=Cannabis sativa TaxID=3483 RepID=A0A803P5U2_CANSA